LCYGAQNNIEILTKELDLRLPIFIDFRQLKQAIQDKLIIKKPKVFNQLREEFAEEVFKENYEM